jgi:hypothetical protein
MNSRNPARSPATSHRRIPRSESTRTDLLMPDSGYGRLGVSDSPTP